MLKNHKDVIIIGAGVSGMTSAIYLKRFNLDVLLIESKYPGGQMTKTDIIENYPGFISIDGFSLSEKIFEQVKNLNIDYVNEEVISIDEKNLEVVTENKIYTAKKIIIATGRKPKKLGIEDNYINKGVSYCAICDGALYKDKIVAVVGSGDSAVSSAIYLSKICKEVYLLVRKDTLKAKDYLVSKLNEKVKILFNKNVTNLYGEDKLEYVELNNHDKLNVDGLFIYIGSIPNTNIINVDKENGYILVDDKMKTSNPNIYACGDVIKKDVYQITTAISDATIASINCSKEL